MSTIGMTYRHFVSPLVYIVEAGTVIGVDTIGQGIKPAATPPDNWPQMTCVGGVAQGIETENDEYWCTNEQGLWVKKNETIPVQDYFDITLSKANEISERLQMGVQNKIVQGTAQKPFGTADRKIMCWLKIQGRLRGGNDIRVFDLWGNLQLQTAANMETKATEPVLRFTNEGSSIDSINWPS